MLGWLIFLSLICIGSCQHTSSFRDERRTPFKRKNTPIISRDQSSNEDKDDSIGSSNISLGNSFNIIDIDKNYPCLIPNISRNSTIQNGFRQYRIVVTSTITYFPIFLNWLYYYYRHCPNSEFLYFVCFDKEIERRLQQYQFSCNYTHYLPSVGSRQRLWLIRGLVVRKLIAGGFDVLLADSDALWLRNPFPILAQFPNSDIIASRASYPEDIFERLGATICMGFVYFQSNKGMISLLSTINDEMMKHRQPDDQRIFNHALMKLGITFSRKLNYLTNQVHDTGFIKTKDYIFNITMLSHAAFRRSCDITAREATRASTVAHCSISGKDLAVKQQAEKNFGLWHLKTQWESVDVRNLTLYDMLQAVAKPYEEIDK